MWRPPRWPVASGIGGAELDFHFATTACPCLLKRRRYVSKSTLAHGLLAELGWLGAVRAEQLCFGAPPGTWRVLARRTVCISTTAPFKRFVELTP